MRNWCAAMAISSLLALPLCAQQKSQGTNDDSPAASSVAGASAPESSSPASRTLHVSGNVFGLPAMPQPTPFPGAQAASDTRAPGQIVPRYEVAGMYYYVNAAPGDPFANFGNQGGGASLAYNASRWVGLTGELAVYNFKRNEFPLTGNNTAVTGNMMSFLFGPRLNLRRFDYFVPFVEFLVGGAQGSRGVNGVGNQNAFAVAAGGGVDMVLAKSLAWRVAQIDYLMTNFSGPAVGGNARQDNFRIGTGLVWRFGLPSPPPPPPNHPPVAACSVNPTSVYAGSGDTVAVHVNASSPDNVPLTYSYSATGGAVEGTGSDARWNSTGVGVGSYTVNAKVDDGRGLTASCAADIKVEEKPNHPPTASLSVERSPLLPGERTGVTCNGSDPDNDPLTYSYTTTGGQISGSGSKVQFDSTGLAPGSYTVKCTVNDGRGGTADASGNVEVKEPEQAAEVKQLEAKLALHSIYFPTAQPTVAKPTGGLLASQAATLGTLATDFKQYLTYKPDAHLILSGHADIRGAKDYNMKLSERRVERARSYLVEHGVSANHIDVKAFGDEQNMSDAQVKQLLQDDPGLTPAEKQKLIKNLLTVRLANNRRVDVTLSTTGEQSVRRFPFSAKDALTLLSRAGGEGTAAKKPAPAPAPKKKQP